MNVSTALVNWERKYLRMEFSRHMIAAAAPAAMTFPVNVDISAA